MILKTTPVCTYPQNAGLTSLCTFALDYLMYCVLVLSIDSYFRQQLSKTTTKQNLQGGLRKKVD